MKDWLVQLVIQLHKCFSSRSPSYFSIQQKCILYTSHFITWNIKMMCTQVSRFSEITHFYCFTEDILKGNYLINLVINCGSVTVRKTMTTSGLVQTASGFIHHCFCTISVIVNTVKKSSKVLEVL